MKLQTKVLLSIPVILFALMHTSCTSKQKEVEEEQVQLVNVKTLEMQKIARSVDFSTTLEAQELVHLVSNAPGKIRKINVEVGSKVRKGQILVEMDNTNLQQAKVQLANLKTEFNRMTILLESGSVSQQSYDQVKTQYDVAKTSVANLEENTFIRAPFDGVVSGKYFESGEMYSGSPNTSAGKAAIVSVVQVSSLKAFVNVPETYMALVKNGMMVEVKTDVFPDKNIEGKVVRVYPTIETDSHTFQTEISIANKNESLKPGMFCRVNIDMGQIDAMIVPYQSILKTQGSNERYVFLDDEGVAKRYVVTLGQRFDDQVELISEDIKIGDKLIITGQARLKSGDKITIAADTTSTQSN